MEDGWLMTEEVYAGIRGGIVETEDKYWDDWYCSLDENQISRYRRRRSTLVRRDPLNQNIVPFCFTFTILWWSIHYFLLFIILPFSFLSIIEVVVSRKNCVIRTVQELPDQSSFPTWPLLRQQVSSKWLQTQSLIGCILQPGLSMQLSCWSSR